MSERGEAEFGILHQPTGPARGCEGGEIVASSIFRLELQTTTVPEAISRRTVRIHRRGLWRVQHEATAKAPAPPPTVSDPAPTVVGLLARRSRTAGGLGEPEEHVLDDAAEGTGNAERLGE